MMFDLHKINAALQENRVILLPKNSKLDLRTIEDWKYSSIWLLQNNIGITYSKFITAIFNLGMTLY